MVDCMRSKEKDDLTFEVLVSYRGPRVINESFMSHLYLLDET